MAEWFSDFVALIGPATPKLYQRLLVYDPDGEAGFVLGIPLQLDRNQFESPSLPDSENLTEQWQRRFTKFKDMVK